MGRGNICPDGKYEGVVYVDYDNVLCYTKRTIPGAKAAEGYFL